MLAARCAAPECVWRSRLRDASTALALRLLRARAHAAARSRLPYHLPERRAMADADPAPAAAPEANPDLASDAELSERAAALVAALRSGDSDMQANAGREIKLLVAYVEGSEPKQPTNPRTVAALIAAGVGAALLSLIQHGKVGVAADALCELTHHCVAERQAVIDNLGAEKLMQLLHESQDKLYRDRLAHMLYQFTYCSAWMESLSPESDLISRIFSLRFLSSANALATDRVLSAAERLLDHHPSFRRALASRTSLLVEHLELCGQDDESAVELVQTASRLLQMLQKQDDFNVLVFDQARVHVSCVELLGQLCRSSGRFDNKSFVESTRVLATSFDKSPALRKRIHNLIFACPGALAGVILGVGYACSEDFEDADALISFFDALRRMTTWSAESFLVDPQFATNGLVFQGALEGDSLACTQLRRTLRAAWRTPDCLRVMTQPLKHQKLPVAVSLASLLGYGNEFRRHITSGPM